jgi:hypothetical protein
MKCRLGEIQMVQHGQGAHAFHGVGFNILNERGAPIVTFGYLDPTDAVDARALIEDGIADAEFIVSAGR